MTAENTPHTPTNKKSNTPKKKGPIRWEAIMPFTIFVVLVWSYFFFFFDTHLRHGLEYVATQVNGAEVNIGRVQTSFWNASLEMDRIQVTDSEQPAKNKIQIGRIRWGMLWDALLRGKVAIQDASILEIAIGAPRARPGRVLPPPPPESQSAMDRLKEQALAKAKQEFSQNILGDVAALLSGTDPAEQLKNIEGQLKSSLRIKELQAELQKKEQEWKTRLERLPQAKDLQALQTRLKSVKLDGFSGPAEVQASVQELDSIFKEADAKFNEIKNTSQAAGSDFNTYQNSLKEFEDLIRQDLKDLESRLKIPTLDVQSLTKSLFGSMFLTRVKQAESYMNKARQYMPPKKSSEEKAEFKAPTPHEREKGRSYKFGRPNSYPLFWLKNASISSKTTSGADLSGDVQGSVRDMTDDPPVLGRPTVISFRGEFPKQELFGVAGDITIDHTTSSPVETVQLKVDRFAINGQKLVDNEDVQLGFTKAQASSKIDAELRGDQLKITLNNVFKVEKPDDYLVSAKQPVLAEILKGVVADLPNVTLDASAGGRWTDLQFSLDSNLGRELGKGFEKQLQLKINEARAKLKGLLDEQVGKEKEKLMAEFNKLKSQVEGLLKDKQEEINKTKNQIENAKNEALNGQKKKLENEGKKAVEDLKKKFGF